MTKSSPPSITADEVKHIARLARIHLEDDEIKALASELARILEWANQLGALDLEAIPAWRGEGRMELAAPAPRKAKAQEAAPVLTNAPAVRDGHFSVPRFVE